MAVELEKFIQGQLQALPPDHADRGFLTKALLETQLHLMGLRSPKEILTGEFAHRVNFVATKIPDEIPISNLVDYANQDTFIDHELPLWRFNWRSFINSLEARERRSLTTVLANLSRGGGRQACGSQTLGEFREATDDQLLHIRGINRRSMAFARLAFLKPESPSELPT